MSIVRMSSFHISDMELLYYMEEATRNVGLVLLPVNKVIELNGIESLEPIIQVKILGDSYPNGSSPRSSM